MPNLAKQIETLNREMTNQLPKDVLEVFTQCITDFTAIHQTTKHCKTGMQLPPFTLVNSAMQKIDSELLLKKYDKIVLFFFRGSWCPYCNLELRAIQEKMMQKKMSNVGIFAISPQLPQYSQQLKTENQLNFEILYDSNNAYAKKLGICLTLPEYAKATYKSLNIDLDVFNGSDHLEIPIPAVFVVNQQATITYSFIDPNYMNRVAIEELIATLSS